MNVQDYVNKYRDVVIKEICDGVVLEGRFPDKKIALDDFEVLLYFPDCELLKEYDAVEYDVAVLEARKEIINTCNWYYRHFIFVLKSKYRYLRGKKNV